MPRSIGFALTSGHVTWNDLKTDLSLEDVYDVLEVAKVNSRNEAARQRYLERQK